MIQEKLKEIRTKLQEGKPVEPVTVRELLSWFDGAQRRGWYVVMYINQELEANELTTFPNYESAYIDSPIEFRLVSHSAQPSIEEKHEKESDAIKQINNDPTYRISRLKSASAGLISVKPDSPLSEAIALMVSHDYSQLPVMQSERDLKGVISWRSIGQNLSDKTIGLTVRELMDSTPYVVLLESSLFKAIPTIVAHDYVIVKNQVNVYCGIVTASDLSLQFNQMTEPFLLVGEIENHIRQILANLSVEELASCKDERDTSREIKSVADLSFGEYNQAFRRDAYWSKLALNVHQGTFCTFVDRTAAIRNDIMHFDPDGITDESLENLRRFARLLQVMKHKK